MEQRKAYYGVRGKRMLQKMDLPYIDSLYESLQADVANEINEKNKKSPFLAYLPPIKYMESILLLLLPTA